MINFGQREIDFYSKNGYLIINNVISEEECDYFLNLCKKFSFNNDNKNLSEIPQVHREIPETLQLMKNKNVVSIIETLLNGESVGLQTVCSFKKANTPSGNMAWNAHQDGTYIEIDQDKYISGDIALDNHKKNSGVLYVYPGSHKEEILDYIPNKSFGESIEKPGNKVKNIPTKYKPVELFLKKGSLLSFHSNVIHGSSKNTTKNDWRPLFLMAFMKKGATYNPGKIAKRKAIELK